MTASELIKKLLKVDPDTRIFTRGYEGGYTDAEISEVETYVLNINTSWYYGEHEVLREDEKVPKGKQTVKGVCL